VENIKIMIQTPQLFKKKKESNMTMKNAKNISATVKSLPMGQTSSTTMCIWYKDYTLLTCWESEISSLKTLS
jgi:hypothetical protein